MNVYKNDKARQFGFVVFVVHQGKVLPGEGTSDEAPSTLLSALIPEGTGELRATNPSKMDNCADKRSECLA